MIYIDENGNQIETYDLTLGYLVDHEWVDHPEQKQIGHYDYTKSVIREADEENEEEYHLIQKYVIDTPYVGAWREVTAQKYVLYTEAELLHQQKLRYSERLDMLEMATESQANINKEQSVTNDLLSAQVMAVSDRGDFIEDCIAEMAGVVYA